MEHCGLQLWWRRLSSLRRGAISLLFPQRFPKLQHYLCTIYVLSSGMFLFTLIFHFCFIIWSFLLTFALKLVAFYAITKPQSYGRYGVYMLGAFLWLGFLSILPHKVTISHYNFCFLLSLITLLPPKINVIKQEERFLYPMYPLICLGAGLFMYFIAKVVLQISEFFRKVKVQSLVCYLSSTFRCCFPLYSSYDFIALTFFDFSRLPLTFIDLFRLSLTSFSQTLLEAFSHLQC